MSDRGGETLGEAMERIAREAERLGAAHVTAGMDQLQARLRDERERALVWRFEDNDVEG
jgi:hypothetical protein